MLGICNLRVGILDVDFGGDELVPLVLKPLGNATDARPNKPNSE